jgi:aminoglycoside 3-N-acetyltransferase
LHRFLVGLKTISLPTYFIKKIIPAFMQPLLRKVWRLKYRAALLLKKTKGEIVTEALLVQQLKSAGITPGDKLLVHSSLRTIGYVQNGAHTVINALLKTLTTNGTLLMPAFPAKGLNKEYVQHTPTFNYYSTPSSMGIITETFRVNYATHRSLHVTDSVCALGADADYFTNTHLGQLTPYGALSPFGKLCNSNGKILLIGVNLNSLTNFHTLEDAITDFKFEVYDTELFTTTIIDKNNNVHYATTKVHNPKYSAERQCLAFETVFIADGIMKKINLGNAISYVIDANKLHKWMLTNYTNKGITLYTPQGS